MSVTTNPMKIEVIDRLTNSRNGNPRYQLFLSSLSGEHGMLKNTSADASFNYEIGNPGFRVGDLVRVTIGGRGTITGIERANA